ncbi:restriction endonuclease subunit S [Lactobacillus paragasseri]|uniref:restriction endonuclease subunit S n=1 Tax=Lactobacillus paragasseri TaxID=2107999 RepID=UPI00217D650F|nr:restriction endonuclease subunit S [Lactobacillus paragasseri]
MKGYFLFFLLLAWEQRKLGEVANILRGASPRPIKDPKWFDSNSKIGWIRISDVTNQHGRIYNLEQHLSKAGQDKTRVVYPPSLLLSIAASVGYPVITYIETGVHDGFVILDKPKFNLDFMFFKLQQIQKTWNKYGQPGSQININSSIVSNTKILIPTNNEQLQISNILKKIEKCIHLQQRKLNDLKLIRKAVSQTIFPGNNKTEPKILVDKTKEIWRKEKAKNIFKEIDIRKVPNNIILSTTQDGRVVTRESLGRNLLFSQDKLKNYKLVKSGQFIIHLRSFKGGFATSNLVGIVSPTYTIFDFKDKDENDSHFWSILFTRYNFIQSLKSVTEGIRYNGVAIKFSQFADLRITYPTLKTQLKISNLFRSLNNDIEKQESKITKLQESKQFLLQNMFI